MAVLVFELTDCRTYRVHLITEQAAAAGRRSGRYRAVCGIEVVAASLVTPAQGFCPVCVTFRAPAR